VRVIQASRDPDFFEKSLRADNGAQVRAQDLQCNFTVVLEILREINGRHPTFPDMANDGIAIRERGLKTVGAWHAAPKMGGSGERGQQILCELDLVVIDRVTHSGINALGHGRIQTFQDGGALVNPRLRDVRILIAAAEE
jgi:hypothetical protein